MTRAELQLEWDDAVRWVLKQPQGRRFLFDLIHEAGKRNRTSFTGDALTSAYNEGQRSVGNWLSEQVERCEPDLFDKMMLEGSVTARLRRSAADHVHGDGDSESR